jgi:hypothetical protein
MGALRIVFVTSRAEKAREAERLGFEIERLDLDIAEPQALDPSEIVEAKARAAYAAISRPVLVEDSGLAIHAWAGFPGALVKWVEKSAGVAAIPRCWNRSRTVTAVCAIGFCDGAVRDARGRDPRRDRAGAREPRLRVGHDLVPEGEARVRRESAGGRTCPHRRAWDAMAARLPLRRRD